MQRGSATHRHLRVSVRAVSSPLFRVQQDPARVWSVCPLLAEEGAEQALSSFPLAVAPYLPAQQKQNDDNKPVNCKRNLMLKSSSELLVAGKMKINGKEAR